MKCSVTWIWPNVTETFNKTARHNRKSLLVSFKKMFSVDGQQVTFHHFQKKNKWALHYETKTFNTIMLFFSCQHAESIKPRMTASILVTADEPSWNPLLTAGVPLDVLSWNGPPLPKPAQKARVLITASQLWRFNMWWRKLHLSVNFTKQENSFNRAIKFWSNKTSFSPAPSLRVDVVVATDATVDEIVVEAEPRPNDGGFFPSENPREESEAWEAVEAAVDCGMVGIAPNVKEDCVVVAEDVPNRPELATVAVSLLSPVCWLGAAIGPAPPNSEGLGAVLAFPFPIPNDVVVAVLDPPRLNPVWAELDPPRRNPDWAVVDPPRLNPDCAVVCAAAPKLNGFAAPPDDNPPAKVDPCKAVPNPAVVCDGVEPKPNPDCAVVWAVEAAIPVPPCAGVKPPPSGNPVEET